MPGSCRRIRFSGCLDGWSLRKCWWSKGLALGRYHYGVTRLEHGRSFNKKDGRCSILGLSWEQEMEIEGRGWENDMFELAFAEHRVLSSGDHWKEGHVWNIQQIPKETINNIPVVEFYHCINKFSRNIHDMGQNTFESQNPNMIQLNLWSSCSIGRISNNTGPTQDL